MRKSEKVVVWGRAGCGGWGGWGWGRAWGLEAKGVRQPTKKGGNTTITTSSQK